MERACPHTRVVLRGPSDAWIALAPILAGLAFVAGFPELGQWILSGVILGLLLSGFAQSLADDLAGMVPFLTNASGVLGGVLYLILRASALFG